MTIKLEKEMNNMCNLSSGIREEGRIEATIQFIKNIMFKRHSSAEEAMELLGIDKAEYPATWRCCKTNSTSLAYPKPQLQVCGFFADT